MTLLAVTMARILLTWALTLLMVVGIGAAVMHLAGDRPRTGADWVLSGWVGMATVTGVLQLWHLNAPVIPITYIALLFTAVVGLRLLHASLPYPALWRWLRTHPALALALVMLGTLAANQALLGTLRYDAGLYDIQVIQWSRSFAIVPGLGNLHGRFAFNNSTHLWFALADVAPTLPNRGLHLGNGVPLLLLLAGSVLALGRVLRHRALDPFTLYALALLPLAVRYLLFFSIYNVDTDLFATLAGLVVLGEVLRLLTTESALPGRLVTLAVLVAWGITLKLSFAVLGAGLALVGLWRWWGITNGPANRLRTVATAVIAGLALVVPWMRRGVVLSGYPLYPSTALAVPVDWQMIPAAAELEAFWVRAWARQHMGYTQFVGPFDAPVVVGLDWLGPWFLRNFTTTPNLFDVTLPIIITAGMLGVALYRRVTGLGWWLFAPLGVALVFWWVVAPEPRFAGALWWGSAAVSAALVGAALLPQGQLCGTVALVALACVALAPLQLRWVMPASPDNPFHGVAIPRVDSRDLDGVTFYYPVGGGDQCWAAPLPCAPDYPQIDGLCLREPGNLAAGFSNRNGDYTTCTEGRPE